MADDSSDLLDGLHSLDITACKDLIRQLQARRERRRELVERLQEKLKALNNELAARKEEADRCKQDLLDEQAKNRRLAEKRRQRGGEKEVASIQDDLQREQEMELQTANVRRFMETTLQEQVQRNRTQNELGIRIYDEVELMVEKSAEEQALESRYIDTVLVTYCIPNSDLKYNLSFRVDKDMKSKKLREDACLYWGLSEVDFILKTLSNAKVHDELTIQSCFNESEDAHFSLVQKTPKNTSLMDRELTNILPKAGRKARRGGANKSSHDTGKSEGTAAGGTSGELAEQMMLLPGLFAFMTQRDQNVKQHLQRMKLRNIFIYLTVLVLALYDIYLNQPPEVNFFCREGAVRPLTSGEVHAVDFVDIRTPDLVWAWLADTVAAELFTPSSLLRSGNYVLGFLQVLVQNVQPPTEAQCPKEDASFALPPNVSCFAMTYADTTAQTGELGEIRNYFEGKIGLDGRYHQTSPWQWGSSRMSSPTGGEASTQMSFSAVDGSGYSVEYNLQDPSPDLVRQAFLQDVAFLSQANWLDTQTRAVHVQFMLYNPNYDLWVPNRYSFEMTGFGTVTPKIDVSTFRPGMIEYDIGLGQLGSDLIRCFFVLYICLYQVYWDFMYERKVNGAGWKHFFTIQGAVDLSIGSVFFAMFGLRYTAFNAGSVSYLSQHFNGVLDATELSQVYNQHLALDAAMAALVLYRVLYFLQVNRHVFIIWTSVAKAAKVALRLLVIVVPVIAGLTVLSMGVSFYFDQYTRTFWSALTRILLMIFGDDETVKAYDPNRGWQLTFNVVLYYATRLIFVNSWFAVLIHEYQKTRVAAGYSTKKYRWKEYDYVVWCLPWPRSPRLPSQ
ncbi:unnamed protein product [Symbiodinium pilosum]|uniref:Polycystin domain-containing protein n=1 Tax=Symbiodinium pilosum TaxID=2952 RepID=A0A812X3T9_SYMPI|nr:unnamed protein product [Symbiodinium pilosum]